MSSSVLLKATNLHISFGGIHAAKDVHLDVFSGEKLAIIGPNGAGKTTFLNICTGYLRPSQGTVLFKNQDITAKSPRNITKLGIARAFQIPQLFDEFTVLDNMFIALSSRDKSWSPFKPLGNSRQKEEALHILTMMHVCDFATQLVSELPEGVRKLVDISLAMSLSPTLLLLDEPTSSVSSQEKFEVMDILIKALQASNVTCIFVEHDMDVVSNYADRVAVWNRGNIQALGKPDEVLANKQVIKEVIGEINA